MFSLQLSGRQRGSESDTWRLIASTSTTNYDGSVLTYWEPKKWWRLRNTDTDTADTFSEKKKERTNITLQLDVLFVSDSLSITWCEDQVEPSHKPNRKAYFQHFCAESCMKSYGCKLHPDQNFKLYKPAVKLHLSLITDPPLHRWYKREQSVLRCSKRNHSPSSTWKHGTHMWVSVRPFAHLLTDVLQEELPMHVNSPKKLKFPGRDKHNTLRLFCRYHFTAALKRLQPDHKSWLLSVLPRCHRDFGCHTLVLIPPRGQQTARGTEPLGELCQP